MYKAMNAKRKIYEGFFEHVLFPLGSKVKGIQKFVDKHFEQYTQKEQEVHVPWQIREVFLDTIRITLANCSGITSYHEDNDEFDNFIYYEMDGESELVGCVDYRGFLLLDSRFIYKKVCKEWKERRFEMKTDKIIILPAYPEFYSDLYHARILNKGIFFPQPLYDIKLNGTPKKWYFCISKDYFGYKDEMVEWMDC